MCMGVLKIGGITKSGNFKLVKKITSLDELWEVLKTEKSLFAKHRMYPSAFFYSWHFREVQKWLDYGFFWIVKKNK